MTADLRRHLFYWILPTAVSGTLVAFYFSGVWWLQSFVVPKIGREFGAAETVQHLTLVAILVICVEGARHKRSRPERWLFTFLAAATTFMLLEELDYGLHFIGLFTEIKKVPIRNIHNIGETTNIIKVSGNVLHIGLFVILPIAAHFAARLPRRGKGAAARGLRAKIAGFLNDSRVRYFVPSYHGIITIVLMIATVNLALQLQGWDVPNNGRLRGNISEFQEIFVYGLWLAYFMELVHFREPPARWTGSAPETGA